MPARVKPEKAANVRALYAGGMSIDAIRKKLHMSWETVVKICDGIPDPHQGKAQQLFTAMNCRKRISKNAVPVFDLQDADY